ncbi:hypothetical protein [Bradyrhizobium sp. LTSP849]|uniref:hypothetical protein n=1 Tax=Bradyrhizobium sp. LTSP849 TaxID=1615890 RepID=UPI0006793672|nr:hypothetical protein [Bradyrhizobium sp. LTSP849]
MKYGSLEYQYAEPIARALAEHEGFSKWVLSKSKFSEDADARLLKNEMMLQRQTPTAEWWRFHFFMGCKNPCCSGGRETDIFAVFEAQDKRRFAMHFEVKQPKDRFDPARMQEKRYALRAQCWVDKAPPKVLKHQDASLGIFFSEDRRDSFEPVLSCFPTQITFEEIEREFPQVAEWRNQGRTS